MALAAVAGLGLSPAHAIPKCDVPVPPPICPGEESPPTPPKPPTPYNDEFPGGLLTGLKPAPDAGFYYTIPGTTVGATMEPGEPRPSSPFKDCGTFGVSNSVWYRIFPSTPSEGRLELNTWGSSFDTVLAIYRSAIGVGEPGGTTPKVDQLTQVNCSNDNSGPGWTDEMLTPVLKNKIYYVQLSGTGGARSGAYKLRVGLCPTLSVSPCT